MAAMTPDSLLAFRPRTLMGIPLDDLSVTNRDHLSLNIRFSKEQLCHCSSEAVFSDAPNSYLLGHY
tara:strand:+ start:442 stop:639 length:198 start_codon:yes stop_codon:yes gene_type:complete